LALLASPSLADSQYALGPDPTYLDLLASDVRAVEAQTVVENAPPVVVNTQFHAQSELGEYEYGYSNPTSSKYERKDAYGNVEGTYSYLGPDGRVVTNNYVADPAGFRSSLAPSNGVREIVEEAVAVPIAAAVDPVVADVGVAVADAFQPPVEAAVYTPDTFAVHEAVPAYDEANLITHAVEHHVRPAVVAQPARAVVHQRVVEPLVRHEPVVHHRVEHKPVAIVRAEPAPVVHQYVEPEPVVAVKPAPVVHHHVEPVAHYVEQEPVVAVKPAPVVHHHVEPVAHYVEPKPVVAVRRHPAVVVQQQPQVVHKVIHRRRKQPAPITTVSRRTIVKPGSSRVLSSSYVKSLPARSYGNRAYSRSFATPGYKTYGYTSSYRSNYGNYGRRGGYSSGRGYHR